MLPQMNSGSENSATTHRSGGYAIVFVGIILQQVLLFFLNVTIVGYFGTSSEMDAFRTALTPAMSVAAILAGVGGTVLVTILARRDSPEAPGTATLLCLQLLAVALGVACLGSLFSREVSATLHPFFDAERASIDARLIHILSWMIVLNTAIGLAQAVLNAELNFWVPAVSGIIGPIVTVGMVLILKKSWGIDGVAWATVAGAMASVGFQFPWLVRVLEWPALHHWREVLQQSSIVGPLLLGMGVLKLDPLVDQYLGSGLAAGEISRLDLASRVLMPFLFLASGTLSTVTFPRIARTVNLGKEALRAEVRSAFQMLFTLSIPAVFVIVQFAEPLVRDIYQRQAFTPADTQAVGSLLQMLAGLLLGAAFSEVSTKILIAMRDSLTPNLILAGTLLVGFVMKWMLIGSMGVAALAMVTSGVFLFTGLIQTVVVCRRIRFRPDLELFIHFGQCAIASALASSIGNLALHKLPVPFPALCGLVVGGMTYLAALAVMFPPVQGFPRLFRRT